MSNEKGISKLTCILVGVAASVVVAAAVSAAADRKVGQKM